SLLAERDTRGLPRVFVEYANLMDDWCREVKRISVALAIDLDIRDEGAIEDFLAPGLRHHRRCGPVTELFGADWISAAYQALSAAARDEPWDQPALDRVFEAYRASEQGFRTMFEDFHRLRKLYRLVPISIVKLILEVNAIARRRSETWA
ncbi:MAG: sulfotransferase family protein, partial [Mycobacterium sp.]